MPRLSTDDPRAGTLAGPPQLSRRAILGAAAAGATGLLVGRVTGPVLTTPATAGPAPAPAVAPEPTASPVPAASPPRPAVGSTTVHPFFGPHQAGVTTPAQGHLDFAAFDMVAGADRRDLVHLLRDWSAAAARMTAGQPVAMSGDTGSDPESPPADTGEARDLPASALTITIGLGPGLFGLDGIDRYGIAAERPPELEPLPPFARDALDPARSGGDLCVQACADDPLVAFHAVHSLSRIAAGRAAIRWSQTGFVGASTESSRGTPRNLMGFKDGTGNVPVDDEAELDRHVWLPPTTSPAWLAGGTYLVVRKIGILVEGWDREPLSTQEAAIGRTKAGGAPLSGGDEASAPDFAARVGGVDAIDARSHVRLAHPSNNGGIRILRRGYNYVDGATADGCLDAGLLFIAFQHSPERFVTLQRSLAVDKLNEYIRHVGSAVFVLPPGASEGGFVGETLLG